MPRQVPAFGQGCTAHQWHHRKIGVVCRSSAPGIDDLPLFVNGQTHTLARGSTDEGTANTITLQELMISGDEFEMQGTIRMHRSEWSCDKPLENCHMKDFQG